MRTKYMAEHPCQGMTKAEISAFEAIAINRPPRCSNRTLERLLARCVIAREEKRISLRDGLPPSVVSTFYVPLAIHMQWCEWTGERHRGGPDAKGSQESPRHGGASNSTAMNRKGSTNMNDRITNIASGATFFED